MNDGEGGREGGMEDGVDNIEDRGKDTEDRQIIIEIDICESMMMKDVEGKKTAESIGK